MRGDELLVNHNQLSRFFHVITPISNFQWELNILRPQNLKPMKCDSAWSSSSFPMLPMPVYLIESMINKEKLSHVPSSNIVIIVIFLLLFSVGWLETLPPPPPSEWDSLAIINLSTPHVSTSAKT